MPASRLPVRIRWRELGLLLLLLLVPGVHAPAASAHADLARTEPPMDGLVLTAPSELRLFFTEEVARTDPTPTVRVLDEQGHVIETSIRPPESTGNARELIVDLGPVGEGIYTVEWRVRSATDGHILSGTYAFRVGGGVPPGQATTEGERPQAWAVAARWATFLGIAVAAAGFLFGTVVLRDDGDQPRRRLDLVIAGLALALLASLLEPVLLALFPPDDVSLTLAEAVRSLPTAWWWRPGALLPVLALALAVRVVRHGQLSRPLAWIGGVGSLLALLGLSLTSHAAGQEAGRELAVTSDLVHQVAVALWVGGLVHLAVWWRGHEPSSPAAPVLRRFSTIALALFAVGLVTGILNAWVIFPALSDLWESDYGIVLLVKLALLVLPFALAAWHRVALRRASRAVLERLGGLRRTVRLETLLVIVVLVPAAVLALSAPPVERPSNLVDEITLAMPATTGDPARSEIEAIAHLTVAPGRQGENAIRVRLTDPDGAPLPNEPEPRVFAGLTSLDHEIVQPDAVLEPVDATTQTYRLDGLRLTIDGWWRLRTTIRRAGLDDLHADFYLLVPDPNMNGFDAPPRPDTDPEAEAVLNDALATMREWTSARWWQALSGGNDSLIVSEFAVTTTAANGEPPSFMNRTIYSGGFAPRADGSAPDPPARNSYTSITVGDQGWLIATDGSALEQPPARYLPIERYPETYAGAEHIRFGGIEEVDGKEARIVTFHSPERSDQAEAWFAFWISTETGDLLRLAMVAQSHYMVWEYTDINGDFTIEVPDDEPAATPTASPVATPVQGSSSESHAAW